MAALSVRSDFSISSNSASSSSRSASVHWKNARIRAPPRRGQVKIKVFGSIVALIASFLGLTENGGNANEGAEALRGGRSAIGVDMVDGRLSFDEGTTMETSGRSSPALGMSASSTPGFSSGPNSRAISFDGRVGV